MRDRVAVVTGGAHGIGYAIVERLSQAGARVLLADINEEQAQAAAKASAPTVMKCRAFVPTLPVSRTSRPCSSTCWSASAKWTFS